jgi:hypothetical protein
MWTDREKESGMVYEIAAKVHVDWTGKTIYTRRMFFNFRYGTKQMTEEEKGLVA